MLIVIIPYSDIYCSGIIVVTLIAGSNYIQHILVHLQITVNQRIVGNFNIIVVLTNVLYAFIYFFKNTEYCKGPAILNLNKILELEHIACSIHKIYLIHQILVINFNNIVVVVVVSKSRAKGATVFCLCVVNSIIFFFIIGPVLLDF